jgi:photosystem II stability/assembly factor-like uncharacterized protein
VICVVRTAAGDVAVNVEDEVVLGDAEFVEPERPKVDLPLVVAAAVSGSTVVAVVERRPPLVVSTDAGSTWREAGGGLPAGFDVAVAPDDPDRVLYAARNRLYLSVDGGRFWRSLEPELPDVVAVAWVD